MNLTEYINALRVMKNLIQTNARSLESIKMPTRNEKNIQALKVWQNTSIPAHGRSEVASFVLGLILKGQRRQNRICDIKLLWFWPGEALSFHPTNHRSAKSVMRAYCLHGGKGAFFLILKLDLAYQGLLKLSRVELHKALVHLGQWIPGWSIAAQVI